MNNPRGILDLVEDYYNIPYGSIDSWCRTQTIAEARALSMYIMKQNTTYSYEELSKVYKREVSGIKKNCKKIVNMLKKGDKRLITVYNKVNYELNRLSGGVL